MKRNGTASSPSGEAIPALLKFWRDLDAALPRLAVGGVDMSLALFTAVFLTMLRYLAEFVMVTYFGWPSDILATPWTSACFVSIFHSTNLVPALYAGFLSQPYSPSEPFDKAPQWWQESIHALLQFCTGYMIYDGVVNLLILKGLGEGMDSADFMFLGHHLATGFYMTATRVVKAGHMSAMMCMFLGEITNPFHNGWYIGTEAMKLSCCNGPWMEKFLFVDTFLFASTYLAIRVVIAPLTCLHMTYDLWAKGTKHIPVWMVTVFSILIWGVIFGSIPWIVDCWNMMEDYLPASNSSESEL